MDVIHVIHETPFNQGLLYVKLKKKKNEQRDCAFSLRYMYPSHLNVSNVSRNKGYLPLLKFNSKVNADCRQKSKIAVMKVTKTRP